MKRDTRFAIVHPRTGAIVVAAAVLLIAACGGGSGSGTASSEAGTAVAASASSSQSATAKLLAYSQCMRVHGVPNFPDPDSTGQLPKTQLKRLTVSGPVIRAADAKCDDLLPVQPGINAPLSPQQQQDYLKAVMCMRQHGIHDFPNPIFSGDSVHFPVPAGLNTKSPQVLQAETICRRLIPAGLPDSQ